MHWARCLSRRTEKGRAYGVITAKALAVLEALLWGFHNAKSGLCFPTGLRRNLWDKLKRSGGGEPAKGEPCARRKMASEFQVPKPDLLPRLRGVIPSARNPRLKRWKSFPPFWLAPASDESSSARYERKRPAPIMTQPG
jgi:hypothetical protein